MSDINRPFRNPFFLLLLLVGITFSITACAYGVMTVRGLHRALDQPDQPAHQLMQWMDQHGFWALMIQLGLLAVCTFAAIGTDDYWQAKH